MPCNFGLNHHEPVFNDNHTHNHESHSHGSCAHGSHTHGSCDHAHDHGSHAHSHDYRQADKKALSLAISITFGVMILEIIYGITSGSLALVSDAIHMFTHTFALFVSLIAIFIATKKRSINSSFGYYRAEVLASFINAIMIFASVIWIIYEAILRALTPITIDVKTAGIVAVIGLVANLLTAVLLMKGDLKSLNLRSAFLHMLADAFSSVAIILGYIFMAYTGLIIIDLILAVMVALVISKWAYDIFIASSKTLLEISPLNADEILKHLESKKSVLEIHDLHIWKITDNMINLTAHVKIAPKDAPNALDILRDLNSQLSHYNIVHSTFQFEWD